MAVILFLRRFWPIIWPILAAATLAWFAYSKGHDSRDGEVDGLRSQLATSKVNVATLDAALARQNAAVADAGERARIAQQRAGEALAKALAADKAAASLRARAGKLAGAVQSGPCVSIDGDALSRDAWGKL